MQKIQDFFYKWFAVTGKISKSNTAKKPPPPTSSKKQDIIGTLLLALALILVLGILTGDTYLGELGRLISEILTDLTFGLPNLILPVLLVLYGIHCLLKKPFLPLIPHTAYAITLLILLSITATMFQYLSETPDTFPLQYGGIIGQYIVTHAESAIGIGGTVIIMMTLYIILFIAWLNFSFDRPLETLRTGAEQSNRLFQKLSTRFLGLLKLAQEIQIPKPKFTYTKHPQSGKSAPPAKQEKPDVVQTDKRPTAQVPTPPVPKESPQDKPDKTTLTILEPQPLDEETQLETDPVLDTLREKDTIDRYSYPSLDFLKKPVLIGEAVTKEECYHNADIIKEKLANFGIEAKVTKVHPGPVITMFEVEPAPGVKISRIAGLADDLALAMAAKGIRIIAPIPGKSVIGIEIPNREPEIVYLRDILESPTFQNAQSKLTIGLGKRIDGSVFCADLAVMPHLLIAGATGSGKSVGINTIITSILYKAHPLDVQFIMIDPKKLELSIYKDIAKQHLLTFEGIDEEVLTKPNNVRYALKCVENEMDKRYTTLAKYGTRNIADFNKRVHKLTDEEGHTLRQLYYIVVIIDELADLMIMGGKEVEESLARLAQMARAVGIHLVLATQRPSVDVITGTIKANFPARISYQVTQRGDSRIILDMNGAEQLIGSGDMLYLPPGRPKPIRIQNAYISTAETEAIIDHISQQPHYVKDTLTLPSPTAASGNGNQTGGGRDDLFFEALKLVVRHQQGSISLIQRRLKIGYARAARLIDQLEEADIVGPFEGSKSRQVLVDEDYLEHVKETDFI